MNKQTVSKDNTENIVDNDMFSVSFKPTEFTPEIAVNFALVNESDDVSEFYHVYYYICTLSQAGEEIQSFEMELTERLKPEFFDFVDIDFDGCLDMMIMLFSQSTNWLFEFYRYDVENNIFCETPFFSTNGRNVRLFKDSEQIIVTIFDGHEPNEREMYQYTNTGYSLVRTENIIPDFKTETYNVVIGEYTEDMKWTEIYSASLTKDEYYEDFEFRDNCLRFGIK